MSGLRVAIVVHGRFHAFDLSRELQAQGHETAVFSNYPAWAAARFGLDRRRYQGLAAHGVVERAVGKMPPVLTRSEPWRHRWFGRWAARALEGYPWDVVHCWSGVSDELLRSPRVRAAARVLMRGSAHILDQSVLLREEEARVGAALDRPSPWMIEREQSEYARADRILVLSEFARASFARHGYGPDKVDVLPLGVSVDMFRPTAERAAARVERIRQSRPLTILYVGTLSARKGLRDLVTISRMCETLPMQFVLVGPRLPETSALLAGAGPNVTVLDKRDQHDLPEVYWSADAFIFPTIEDGFGMVLTQARAAGLPVLCTPHCAGPDLITVGRDGWVLPVREPEAFADRLRWCHGNRDALAEMVATSDVPVQPRDWSGVAERFVQLSAMWMAGQDVRKAGT